MRENCLEQFLGLVAHSSKSAELLSILWPFMLSYEYSNVEDLVVIAQAWLAVDLR